MMWVAGMKRIIAVLLFLGALVRIWFDWQATTSEAEPFRFTEIGAVWANIHFGSLQVIQPAIERYIGPWLWEWVMFPILLAPLAPVLLVLAALFWFWGRKKKSRRI